METTSISPKEFLTQTEQKYGKGAALVLKLAMGLGGLGLVYVLGPTILGALTLLTAIVGQAIVLAGLLGVTFALWMLFSNPSVRAMLHDHFDGFIRSLTKASIKINPIDRLQAYADEYLEGKRRLVRGVKDSIKAKQNWHLDQVDSKTAELKKMKKEADVRKKRSCPNGTWTNNEQGREDREEFRLASEQIDMLEQSLARFEKMGRRYELFLALLDKYERAFDLSIRKTQNTVQIVEDEYEASQKMAEATQAMSGVMEGTDQRTKLFNMTMEYVSQEIAGNVAQIEGFFDRTRSIIASADIQGDVAEDRLLAELNDMGEKTDQAINGLEQHSATSVGDMISRVRGADGLTTATAAASMPSGDSKYADLLRKVRRQ